jgi:hypothetical protein
MSVASPIRATRTVQRGKYAVILTSGAEDGGKRATLPAGAGSMAPRRRRGVHLQGMAAVLSHSAGGSTLTF